MSIKTGTITSMWINRNNESIGLAVIVHNKLYHSIHQVKVPYEDKDHYKLGDTILIDVSSNTLIYQ